MSPWRTPEQTRTREQASPAARAAGPSQPPRSRAARPSTTRVMRERAPAEDPSAPSRAQGPHHWCELLPVRGSEWRIVPRSQSHPRSVPGGATGPEPALAPSPALAPAPAPAPALLALPRPMPAPALLALPIPTPTPLPCSAATACPPLATDRRSGGPPSHRRSGPPVDRNAGSAHLWTGTPGLRICGQRPSVDRPPPDSRGVPRRKSRRCSRDTPAGRCAPAESL